MHVHEHEHRLKTVECSKISLMPYFALFITHINTNKKGWTQLQCVLWTCIQSALCTEVLPPAGRVWDNYTFMLFCNIETELHGQHMAPSHTPEQTSTWREIYNHASPLFFFHLAALSSLVGGVSGIVWRASGRFLPVTLINTDVFIRRKWQTPGEPRLGHVALCQPIKRYCSDSDRHHDEGLLTALAH